MIEKNWQELIRPEKPQIDKGADASLKARMIAEPLERGFGVTLGNALRRVLLSSLQGAAVTAIQIEGVDHEFCSIKGVREDVVDIILAIKRLTILLHCDGPQRMTLHAKGAGVATAAQIDTGREVEILNPDLVLMTLDKDAEVRIDFTVTTGKGYGPAERNLPDDAPIGLIAVDALYSPVKRVAYRVERTRQSQRLDYDKLILEVETNGTVKPADAVGYAARILQEQLAVFVPAEEPKALPATSATPVLPASDLAGLMATRVDDLGLSVRAIAGLKAAKVATVGEFLQMTEAEVLATPDFERRSLNEVKEVLTALGLHLGMPLTKTRSSRLALVAGAAPFIGAGPLGLMIGAAMGMAQTRARIEATSDHADGAEARSPRSDRTAPNVDYEADHADHPHDLAAFDSACFAIDAMADDEIVHYVRATDPFFTIANQWRTRG